MYALRAVECRMLANLNPRTGAASQRATRNADGNPSPFTGCWCSGPSGKGAPGRTVARGTLAGRWRLQGYDGHMFADRRTPLQEKSPGNRRELACSEPGSSVLTCSLAWDPKPRLLTRLGNLNLVNNKHVPNSYLSKSLAQRLALLQGLMDSDGHVYAHGRAEFTSKSPRLVEGVRELALSLGMKATVKKSSARQGSRNVSEHYRVRFTPTMPVAGLPRKAGLARGFTEGRAREAMPRIARRSIQSVKLVGIKTTVCIAVDSRWGMALAGEQMLPILMQKAETSADAAGERG